MSKFTDFPYTFAEAADRQNLYNSYYTVWLIAPDGSRVYLGHTSRKSGSGLRAVVGRDSVIAKLEKIPGMDTATYKKTAESLVISNGYKVAFGGTIRQEASEADAEKKS